MFMLKTGTAKDRLPPDDYASVLQSMIDSSQSLHCRIDTTSITGSPSGGIASCLFPSSHVTKPLQTPLSSTSMRNCNGSALVLSAKQVCKSVQESRLQVLDPNRVPSTH
jgi:hypothetical protein